MSDRGTTSRGTPIPHECMCEVCGKPMSEFPVTASGPNEKTPPKEGEGMYKHGENPKAPTLADKFEETDKKKGKNND